MADESRELSFELPYEREKVRAFVRELHEDVPGGGGVERVTVAVDHREGSQRAWVVAVFDVERPDGRERSKWLREEPPWPLSDTTLGEISAMAGQGECSVLKATGVPAVDDLLFEGIWPS